MKELVRGHTRKLWRQIETAGPRAIRDLEFHRKDAAVAHSFPVLGIRCTPSHNPLNPQPLIYQFDK
jgi:hypothetical protein